MMQNRAAYMAGTPARPAPAADANGAAPRVAPARDPALDGADAPAGAEPLAAKMPPASDSAGAAQAAAPSGASAAVVGAMLSAAWPAQAAAAPAFTPARAPQNTAGPRAAAAPAGERAARPAALAAADAEPAAAAPPARGAAPTERFDTVRAAGAERSEAPAAPWGVGLSSGADPGAGGNTVKLSGPASQWQQPLREALGEHLQLQVGRNAEQAVIRLEPPMLGRIDISIRHSMGTLQVTLSASNSEVLQQLQAIGDGMRQDLAQQRQYNEVSVSVTPTPRGGAGQAFGQGEADGRQRQPGRDQDQSSPGRALSDGGQPSSTFALNGQE